MTDQLPQPLTVDIADAESKLQELIDQVHRKGGRVIVEQSGIPSVGIVSLEDIERLERMDKEWAEHFKIIDEMREAFKDVPQEEIEREAARALAEVREEMRAEREQATRGHRGAYEYEEPEWS